MREKETDVWLVFVVKKAEETLKKVAVSECGCEWKTREDRVQGCFRVEGEGRRRGGSQRS